MVYVAKPGIVFSHPRQNHVLPAGSALVIDGIAWGLWGAEPDLIEQVTIRFAGQRINANLGPPPNPIPPPGPPTVSFKAQAIVPTRAPLSSLTFTAEATDSLGRTFSTTVKCIVVEPGFDLPIAPGSTWTNNTNSLSFTPEFFCYPATVSELSAIIQFAERNGRKVHAFGSSWSYSDCLETPDFFVDTRAFSRPIETVQRALKPNAPQLCHVQSGMRIRDLYQYLETTNRALETMGGSSGQTLVGAVSTGTHGGDRPTGSIADSVLALHFVGAAGVEYWVEPSLGITDPELLRMHVNPSIDPDNIIYDDDAFSACLVAIGCMGVIYAVVLRVALAYDLAETSQAISWNAFKESLNDVLDGVRFAQCAVDPYAALDDPNGCIVTTRQTRLPPTTNALRQPPDYTSAVSDLISAMVAIDFFAAADVAVFAAQALQAPGTFEAKIAAIVQHVLANHPNLWPALATTYGNFMRAKLPLLSIEGRAHSIMDSGFGAPVDPWTPSWSMESFFPVFSRVGLGFVTFVEETIQTIAQNKRTFLVGYLSLRFTGRTRALLGGQQFSPTCAVEVSALQNVQGLEGLVRSLSAMAERQGGIPHWGQLMDQGVSGIPAVYSGFDDWRSQYARFSQGRSLRTFENPMSIRWRLTTP